MKTKLFLLVTLFIAAAHAQTTTSYPQRVANYTNFSDGGSTFDQNTDEVGMWANTGNKQVASWRSFTSTGLPGGTAKTMGVEDSFEITVNATQAYGQIGVALLASPAGTASWLDRHSNYAVQVNLNGSEGAFDPWEVVSTGGTIDASTINGSSTAADFNIKFTLNSATTMTVEIQKNAETAQSFNITLNNSNITGYAIYLADDWNGTTNANIYWKPTTEYTEAAVLSTSKISLTETNVFYADKKLYITGNKATSYTLELFNLQGVSVKHIENSSKTEIPVNLPAGIYISKIQSKDRETVKTQKIIIY